MENRVWGEKSAPFSIKSHASFYCFRPEQGNPKTVIELAEEKIGFFGYRNRTKSVGGVSGLSGCPFFVKL